MYRPAPKIDPQSAEEVVEQVSSRLVERTGWSGSDSTTEALIRIFSRYVEITVDRLNRVPEKNFLAYLDLLGVSPVPPLPARVPLTFVPIAGSQASVRVPARTQVAAPAEEGETEPVVFETERPLELSSALLRHVFILDPLQDTETELNELADTVISDGAIFLEKRRPSEHVLYLAHDRLFGPEQIARLRLKFDIESGLPTAYGRPEIEWSMLTPEGKVLLKAVSDSTNGLVQSGEVVFEKLPPWPEHHLRGNRSRWLVCRLVSGTPNALLGFWEIRRLDIIVEIRREQLPLDAAFMDGSVVDLSKDFFPFSQRPVFGSTLYLASAEAFSHPGAQITLSVELTNPHGGTDEPPIRAVFVDGHPRIWWEYWNGVRWTRLPEIDSTKGFRIDGTVHFRIPDDVSPTLVNGVRSFYIRARLVSGNYGEEEIWKLVDPQQPAAGLTHRPSTLAPPSIKSLTVDYQLESASDRPKTVLVSNQRVYEDVSGRARAGSAFALFGLPCGQQPALYLGFDAPEKSGFVNRSISLYLQIAEIDRPFSRSSLQTDTVVWQYWSGFGWRNLEVIDQTKSLSRSGPVSFLVPEEISCREDFAGTAPLYWLRIVVPGGSYAAVARLRGILRNTTMGTQTLTLENEVFGSSDGTPNQHFYAARIPILKDIELQVREADLPSEVEGILRDVPRAAVEIRRDEFGREQEAWVRWYEAGDFLGSEPHDRHYTVDRQTGEIRFGNDRHGRIPPRGSNNLRLRRYQTGGGAHGNKRVGKINQLRTAIPYVESVTNIVDAFGGFDLEDSDSVFQRGAKPLRHRNRAVTQEDYEDLAQLASPEVARAKCIPLRDLAADPDGLRFCLGALSLIVVPKSRHTKPLPSTALLEQVRCYLDSHRDLAAELIVLGPEYVRVSVEVDVIVRVVEEAGKVIAAMDENLQQFLHPLSGGSMRQGWRFGELPHRSDIYGLCASVPGVHYIRSLRITTFEERAGAISAGYFLIYSGKHDLTVFSPTVHEQQVV